MTRKFRIVQSKDPEWYYVEEWVGEEKWFFGRFTTAAHWERHENKRCAYGSFLGAEEAEQYIKNLQNTAGKVVKEIQI